MDVQSFEEPIRKVELDEEYFSGYHSVHIKPTDIVLKYFILNTSIYFLY
jgi:hypothetical protein